MFYLFEKVENLFSDSNTISSVVYTNAWILCFFICCVSHRTWMAVLAWCIYLMSPPVHSSSNSPWQQQTVHLVKQATTALLFSNSRGVNNVSSFLSMLPLVSVSLLSVPYLRCFVSTQNRTTCAHVPMQRSTVWIESYILWLTITLGGLGYACPWCVYFVFLTPFIYFLILITLPTKNPSTWDLIWMREFVG